MYRGGEVRSVLFCDFDMPIAMHSLLGPFVRFAALACLAPRRFAIISWPTTGSRALMRTASGQSLPAVTRFFWVDASLLVLNGKRQNHKSAQHYTRFMYVSFEASFFMYSLSFFVGMHSFNLGQYLFVWKSRISESGSITSLFKEYRLSFPAASESTK
jgi:hypothetical protein